MSNFNVTPALSDVMYIIFSSIVVFNIIKVTVHHLSDQPDDIADDNVTNSLYNPL